MIWRLRLGVSWLAFAGAAVWGAKEAGADAALEVRVATALSLGYAGWALYWGAPVILSQWRTLRLKGSLPIKLFTVVGAIWLFSLFGGGIREFLRVRRLAQGRSRR